jgi:hypothetical protein
MKTSYVIALIGLTVVFALAGVRQKQVQKQTKKTEAVQEKSALVAAYTKGFMEGMNATTRHIQFDTNTGRFSLELTNVLSEMKP